MRLIDRDDMPSPSRERPWAQIEWLFDQRRNLAKSGAAQSNYRSAKKFFIAFMQSQCQVGPPRPYVIDENFDEFVLLKFKAYVDDERISSCHRATILSAARQTILAAIANKWIRLDDFIDFSLAPQVRETDARRPYSEGEMAAIQSALDAELRFSKSLLRPYSPVGGGEPLTDLNGGVPHGWWKREENIRWYFEGPLKCQPLTSIDKRAKDHKKFFIHAARSHGGLHELYRRWGVVAWIGPEVILPYVFKLVAETGLNPTVALSLKVKDFEEAHPLTGKAFIRYWKERGSGANELHPSLLKDGSLGLSDRQCAEIKTIWREVQLLTAEFRDKLPVDKRELLFVYQSRSVKFPGAARDFLTDAKTIGTWALDLVEKYDLRAGDGVPLEFSLVRFRPSLVSRLVKGGVDTSVIQAVLGHGSVYTTLRYLDSHDFLPHARKEVHRALEQIRHNRVSQSLHPLPQATFENHRAEPVVFSTPLALCRNVFDPPENVRKAARIAPGKPCTVFNMCLRCPRVVIMEDHLPQLFALRREYLVALESGLQSAPHKHFIQQNIFILNNLLDEDLSEWPVEAL